MKIIVKWALVDAEQLPNTVIGGSNPFKVQATHQVSQFLDPSFDVKHSDVR